MTTYKGEDIVQSAMGGFKTPDGKFVYGSLVLTPRAMIYYDKKVEDVCPLLDADKVELVKGGPVFAVTLKAGGEKQYRTGNAKGWVAKLGEWLERAANPNPEPATPQAPPEPQAPRYSTPLPAPEAAPQAAPLYAPVATPQPVPAPHDVFVGSTYAPPSVQFGNQPVPQPIAPAPAPQAQQPGVPAPAQSPQPQTFVEVILAGLEPRSPAGNEFRLPVYEWSQVWAVVSAMIVMAPANESISKDVAIQVLLPSTGFQVAGLDHRVAAQIIETALVQQQQKTIDIVMVTYSKIDFGVIYEDMKGVPSPPFDADKFLMNCAQFLEFAKDNLGFTITVAKPALAAKPAPSPAPAKPAGTIQFCTQCGRQNAIDARFCVRCGKPMKLA